MLRLPPVHLLALSLVAALVCVSSRADETAPVKVPHIKNFSGLFYPNSAKRLDQQGRVLLEFAISAKGRATDLAVTSAEPPGVFDGVVAKYVQALQFEVPSDWEASGGARRKFHFGFLFLLRPCRDTGPCEELEPFPADQSFTVKTAPLPLPTGH
jgi:TonB family protein